MKKILRVIVGFECSGVVRDAFLAAGHDAISCDFKDTIVPGPHYKGNIFDIINDRWDLGIFHPPCTYLTVTGNKWNKPEFKERFPDREEKRKEAIETFLRVTRCKIPKWCIENPVGIMSTEYRKPNQIIQPMYFGHREPKRTCLWLRGLPRLNGNVSYALDPSTCEPEYHITASGKRLPKWFAYADKSKGQEHRAEIRSVTFPGIAAAMATQWGRFF